MQQQRQQRQFWLRAMQRQQQRLACQEGRMQMMALLVRRRFAVLL